MYLSDECFKMALTDAISVAAKALGIGADVYFEKDKTKYDPAPVQAEQTTVNPQEKAAYDAAIAEVKALLETVVDADTANAASVKLKDIKHAMTSEHDVGVLWNRHIKGLDLFYDRVLKAYTPK